MTTRRPRLVLATAVVMLVAVLGLFAAALLHSNSVERRQAERRFTDKAKVAAALTNSLFASTSQTGQQQNRESFGTRTVDRSKLEKLAKQSRLAYQVILDHNGTPIAFTNGTPPQTLKRLASHPPDVMSALKGRAVWLSDYHDDGGATPTLEYTTYFDTSFGRRVSVSGFGPFLLGTFLGGYLNGIPGAGKANSYVLDSKGLVIGSPVKGQPSGEKVRERGLLAALMAKKTFGTFQGDGGQRAYAVVEQQNSSWRVVLSSTTKELYAGINSTVQWLILLVLAGVGIAAIFLLNRALRSAAAVRDAYVRLEHSNAELEHSNLELKRSNAELEQFASVASHDLQEPLRKVQTFGDQLERRFGDQIPDEAVDYLRRMRRAANRMSTLIEDLLRFSRVTTHARPPQEVDLEKVATEVTSDLDAALQEAHGEVVIDHLPTVEADPLQMRQLLQNLIANGLKFHQPGEAPRVEVRPEAAGEPGMVAFSVTDNGIGFEPEYEERIFRVFERLHPRDVYQGTGIGLALCRKIVERHGGTIVADGRPGQGARFTVTLPVVQATNQAANGNGHGPPETTESRQVAHV